MADENEEGSIGFAADSPIMSGLSKIEDAINKANTINETNNTAIEKVKDDVNIIKEMMNSSLIVYKDAIDRVMKYSVDLAADAIQAKSDKIQKSSKIEKATLAALAMLGFATVVNVITLIRFFSQLNSYSWGW